MGSEQFKNDLMSKDVAMSTDVNPTAEIDMNGLLLCGIEIESTAWTAANLTFQSSWKSGGTYVNVYDDAGTEKTVTVGGGERMILTDPTAFAGIRFIKIRSGTSGTPVAQAAARVLRVYVRPSSHTDN